MTHEEQETLHQTALIGITAIRKTGYTSPELDKLERWHKGSILRLTQGKDAYDYETWLAKDSWV